VLGYFRAAGFMRFAPITALISQFFGFIRESANLAGIVFHFLFLCLAFICFSKSLNLLEQYLQCPSFD